ncbi:MAG: IS4 family transposase [Paludibacter sp.]
MIFKEHKTNIQQILRLIPDNLLSKLALNTKVDYCAKILQGERLFYLLLYAILRSERISQRYLEDVFKTNHFKFLFNYSVDLKVSHSSISEKLSKINLDFFKQSYEAIYERFNQVYSEKEQEQLCLIRVDSSMVAEACTKLQKGMSVGKKKTKEPENLKKQVKYTMAYDGAGICLAELLTESRYLSEDIAIPQVIDDLIKIDKEHRNLYVFDRGVSSLNSYNKITEQQAQFVCRIKTNRKKEVVHSLLESNTESDLGSLELVSDEVIHLFDSAKNCFSTADYRLIVAKRKVELDTTPPQNKGKFKRVENEFYFLTNNFEMSAKQVTECYKKRWDIEVFFRFIKQELNFKHFLSVNENGLQVMLYMTLIAAMLLMLYKRTNEIGFVAAKRRFTMEIEDMITAMAIIYCGGDIGKYGEVDFRRHIPK